MLHVVLDLLPKLKNKILNYVSYIQNTCINTIWKNILIFTRIIHLYYGVFPPLCHGPTCTDMKFLRLNQTGVKVEYRSKSNFTIFGGIDSIEVELPMSIQSSIKTPKPPRQSTRLSLPRTIIATTCWRPIQANCPAQNDNFHFVCQSYITPLVVWCSIRLLLVFVPCWIQVWRQKRAGITICFRAYQRPDEGIINTWVNALSTQVVFMSY